MIVLISHPNDIPSLKVKQYLNYWGYKTLVVDKLTYNVNFTLGIDEDIKVQSEQNTITAAWFRRWPVFHIEKMPANISNYLKGELRDYIVSTFSLLQTQKVAIVGTNNLYNNFADISKTFAILMAKKIGIKTPPMLISNCKKDLLAFCDSYKKVISKPLKHMPFILKKGEQRPHLGYTMVLTQEVLESLENRFYPCIFQQYIEKELEIRVFVFNEQVFACAIFSQLNPKTMVDIRKYDFEKPNRTVPFELPNEVCLKILQLMKSLGLNTGSLDLIIDKHGDYFFLEVNPVGQFDMVSLMGNYHIEEKIAKYLSSFEDMDQ